MVMISKRSLLHVANLTLPSVIVMSANMGCAQCRDRVSQIISKVTGLREYTVDVCNRQVSVKGGVGFEWKAKHGDDDYYKEGGSGHFKFLFKSLATTCYGRGSMQLID